MNALLTVGFALLCVVVLVVAAAAAYLLWLQRHPMPVVNKLRGKPGDPPGNLSYPPDYAACAKKVEVLRDLEYPSASPANTFDLYLPRSAEAGALPLVVWVHGGSFVSGDKAGTENLCTMLCAEGYAVLSANYAVAPEHPYPTAVRQVRELCGFLPALAAQHPQMDVQRLFLGGDSAGAQIVAQFLAAETCPALAASMAQAANMAQTPVLPRESIRGAILTCGPYDLPAIKNAGGVVMRYLLSLWGRAYFGMGGWAASKQARQTVVANWVSPDFPPSYITDGNHMSFEAQARRLAQALRAKGVPVEERYFDRDTYGEVPHEYLFLLQREDARQAYQDIVSFLHSHRG